MVEVKEDHPFRLAQSGDVSQSRRGYCIRGIQGAGRKKGAACARVLVSGRKLRECRDGEGVHDERVLHELPNEPSDAGAHPMRIKMGKGSLTTRGSCAECGTAIVRIG